MEWRLFFKDCVRFIKDLIDNLEDPEYSAVKKNQLIGAFAQKYAGHPDFVAIQTSFRQFFEANF